MLGQVTSICTVAFLSTPSARRATLGQYYLVPFKQFLSTPSARRATCRTLVTVSCSPRISIHALREEGDAV